jgi:hypothetical protein
MCPNAFTAITTPLVGLVGVLAGAFLGNWLTISRTRDERRLTYHNEIAVLLSDLDDTDEYDVEAFYESCRAIVLTSCAKIKSDIERGSLNRFNIAVADFRQFGKRHKAESIKRLTDRVINGPQQPTGKAPEPRDLKRDLTSYLSAMMECAKPQV